MLSGSMVHLEMHAGEHICSIYRVIQAQIHAWKLRMNRHEHFSYLLSLKQCVSCV